MPISRSGRLAAASPFAIRAMRQDDLDQVMALAASIPEAPRWSRTAWQECLAEPAAVPRVCFVAEAGQPLAGFAVVARLPEHCEVEAIAVDERYRRSGVGRALLGAMQDWAGNHGAGTLKLEVRASNDAALRLYRRAGFRAFGRRPGYYMAPEEDAVLLRLELG